MCYSSKWRIVTTNEPFANELKAVFSKELDSYEYIAHDSFKKENVLTYVITWSWIYSYEDEPLRLLIEEADKKGISFVVQRIGENNDDRVIENYNNAEHWSEASFDVVFYGFQKS